MVDDDRLYRIMRLVSDYVRSPSLRHLRDPHSLQEVSRAILNALFRHNPIWTKWTKEREAVARPAAFCWIPADDLRTYLNDLPGPVLTRTDVVERLRAFNEQDYEPLPDEKQRAACLEIYARERAEGTDMPAIVGAINAFVEEDWEARRRADQESYRLAREAERQAAEERLLSGADCKWTVITGSKAVYCRVNGRLFRLEPRPDRRLDLSRVAAMGDATGDFIGRYARRTDATNAVAEIAYKPELRWR